MDSGELITDVLREAVLAGVDLEGSLGGSSLGVGGSQVLEEHLTWDRVSIKELVAGSKKGVTASL